MTVQIEMHRVKLSEGNGGASEQSLIFPNLTSYSASSTYTLNWQFEFFHGWVLIICTVGFSLKKKGGGEREREVRKAPKITCIFLQARIEEIPFIHIAELSLTIRVL